MLPTYQASVPDPTAEQNNTRIECSCAIAGSPGAGGFTRLRRAAWGCTAVGISPCAPPPPLPPQRAWHEVRRARPLPESLEGQSTSAVGGV